MNKFLTVIILFTFGIAFSQKDCEKYKEEYIPINLIDAIEFLNCDWAETLKTEFKNKEEEDAVTQLHFGYGRLIRNGWGLWKGKNQISKYFKSEKIFHPDDMSSIILTSFHRYLNNKPIDMKFQIESYLLFWENQKKEAIQFEKKQNELNKTEFENLKINDTVKIAFKMNKQGKNVWIYPIEDPVDDFNNYSYPNCFVKGIITKKWKKKKKRNYVLSIYITDICGNKEAIYNGLDEKFSINNEYGFFSVGSFEIKKD